MWEGVGIEGRDFFRHGYRVSSVTLGKCVHVLTENLERVIYSHGGLA